MYERPKTYNDARALVASSAGIEFEKFPLKFVAPAYFGSRPQRGCPATVNNGSASLLRLEGQSFALTCWHVLEAYRERLKHGSCIFQIGDCELDPLAQLKTEDRTLDYALIGLLDSQVNKVAKPEGAFGGKHFWSPGQWPPGDIVVGDFVSFGGFPGELRQAISFDQLSFGSYSSGASRVTVAHDDYIVCQFEREHWISRGIALEPSTIRGMSGGPVFVIRHSVSGIMTYEFVGHITEFHENFELLYVRLSRALPTP